jgi:hypothetical protein
MADDSNGYNYSGYESAFVPTGVVSDETPQQSATVNSNPVTSNTGTTQAGSPGVSENSGVGSRRFNPLSRYSSYTYQLSLYMITPDALDEFNRSGRKDIFMFNGVRESVENQSGAYLIAQSGGINNPVTRAPGFEYDYYIDNLKIVSAVTGNSTASPTINVGFDFTITEAYGLSFITNLKRAKEALERYSTTINYKNSTNASRQFFILGLKFLGYDAAGNIITQSNLIDDPDPTFQRFYDINITEIAFKIDGKTTTYSIKAASLPIASALGQKRGVIDKGATQLVGNNVQQILNQLMVKMTKDQADDVNAKKREFGNTYSIRFLGDADSIAQSSIVSLADTSKIKWPMANPTDKKTVNDSLSIKAQPNSNERTVAFNRDTPILQAITSVITQSEYLVNGLKSVYTTAEQPNSETNSQSAEKIDSNKRLKWFNIAPVISGTKFDTIIKDWVFDIEYQVRTYEIPVLMSAYADKTTPYYGAVKRYEYWWTGQNSEVIKYEQSMNNAYFNVSLGGGDASSTATGGNAQVPLVTSKVQPADKLGKLGVGKEAQNSVTTDLMTPRDWANAKIEILGDPDWLSNETANINDDAKSFYGPDGYTIDFKSGQVFIEIKFLEAVDYEHDTGLMKINTDILFFNYPVSIAKQLEGAISYLVTRITHNFRGGKFTQELECKINTFADVKGTTILEEREQNRTSAEAAANNSRETQNLASRYPPPAGLKSDPPPSTGTTGGNQSVGSSTPATTQDTTTKGVANDDAAIEAAWQQDYLGGGRGA